MLPAGLALYNGASGTAVISGIPAKGGGGLHLVTLSAADPGHKPVRQRLALIVDQSPTLIANSTSQWSLASHYLTFRLTADRLSRPVPLENRIVLVTCRSSVVRRRACIR